MAETDVDQVRRFNRIVTERIGALNERYMGRDRPLGEARLLWEVGAEGCEVAVLRGRLGLDSGYVSRLLRSLEGDGLITVSRSSRDRRARLVTLTERGRSERGTLDERSDQLAESLLSQLSLSQRERMVRAMADVERLLSASGIEIVATDSEHPDAVACLEQYYAELRQRSVRPFDPAAGATALPHEVRPPAGEFFVAYLRGAPIGCGAVKHHADAPSEIKRMWIAAEARGLGLGRRLLLTLEECARHAGAHIARIETNSELSEALGLYLSAGWLEVQAFNDEPYADRWLEKRLDLS